MSTRTNLRTITLIVLMLAFLALALGQWVSAQWLYGDGFDAAERRDALARVRHAQAIVRDRADFLRRNAGDNANWDDSYAFMLGRDPTFPARVFSPDSYRLLRLSAFAYVGPDGRLAAVRQYDPQAGRFGEPSPALRAAVSLPGAIGGRFHSGGELSGFAQIAGRIYAWGAAPVTRPDGSGGPLGHLVLLSELDEAFLAAASQTLDSTIGLSVRAAPGEITAARLPVTLADVGFAVRGDTELEARFSLGKVDPLHGLDLTLVTPRVVHATAARASHYFLWSTLLYGAAVTALALWFIERRLLRPVQTAIAAARDAALAESRLKSEFLARMSHEIRTPMNGVLGMAELLGRTPLSPKQGRLLDVIRHSGASLLQVINDILDFSKMEAGPFELDTVAFDPAALITETVEMLSHEAKQKGLRLVAAVEADIPSRLLGDQGRLRQALVNVISNAIKFTEAGEVSVRAAAAAAEAGAVRLVMTVSDTGVGIATDAAERIFAAFGQADTAVTRRFGGTGLGLSIARHLLRRMGGDIHVTSEPGKGSTFTLTAILERAAAQDCPRRVAAGGQR